MNVMVSWVIVVMLIIGGVAFILAATAPVIEQTKTSVSAAEAENIMRQLKNSINDVSNEGLGSSRITNVPSGDWSLKQGIIQFSAGSAPFEPLSRIIKNGIETLSGADVNCKENINSYTMENSYIRIEMQKAAGAIDTKNNILEIESKATGKLINPADSSIIIDDDAATSKGPATSELISTSHKCVVHYFIDSALDYDIYYTLYSGGDFVSIDVRNIK